MKQIDGPAAVAPAVPPPPVRPAALWDRLGGQPAVEAVVHDFVVMAAGDPKVNFTRGGVYAVDAAGVKKLERQLVELISAVTGGPLKYTGRDMKATHKGMGVTDAEFDALAGDLIAVLKKYKVPQAEMDELVGIVASTRKDIVEPKPAVPPPAPVPPAPPVVPAPPAAKKALWDRLGGEAAVKAVVHDFVAAAATDPKVNFTRGGTYAVDAARVELEQQLVRDD